MSQRKLTDQDVDDIRQVAEAIAELYFSDGRAHSESDIVAHTKLPPKRVAAALASRRSPMDEIEVSSDTDFDTDTRIDVYTPSLGWLRHIIKEKLEELRRQHAEFLRTLFSLK
jgi:DNA-binding Lrp family transcriptional regulator